MYIFFLHFFDRVFQFLRDLIELGSESKLPRRVDLKQGQQLADTVNRGDLVWHPWDRCLGDGSWGRVSYYCGGLVLDFCLEFLRLLR